MSRAWWDEQTPAAIAVPPGIEDDGAKASLLTAVSAAKIGHDLVELLCDELQIIAKVSDTVKAVDIGKWAAVPVLRALSKKAERLLDRLDKIVPPDSGSVGAQLSDGLQDDVSNKDCGQHDHFGALLSARVPTIRDVVGQAVPEEDEEYFVCTHCNTPTSNKDRHSKNCLKPPASGGGW